MHTKTLIYHLNIYIWWWWWKWLNIHIRCQRFLFQGKKEMPPHVTLHFRTSFRCTDLCQTYELCPIRLWMFILDFQSTHIIHKKIWGRSKIYTKNCKVCCATAGNTSSLLHHLSRKHDGTSRVNRSQAASETANPKTMLQTSLKKAFSWGCVGKASSRVTLKKQKQST